MNLQSYLKRHSKNLKRQFVIILGSGIHKQAFCCEKNPLNDWGELLKMLDSSFKPTQNYSLDFESIIQKKHMLLLKHKKYKSIQRKAVEEIQLKKISDKLQKYIKKNNPNEYPLSVFASPLVSDVINLNFDLIVEGLIFGKKQNGQFCHRKGNHDFSTLHYRSDENLPTFWHPHGAIDKPKSILLSQRKYFLYTAQVEGLRNHYMNRIRNRKPEEVQPENWFELLAQRPIIICGASLSSAEIDIWHAILCRYRMKSQNNKTASHIFMMYGSADRPNTSEGYINHFYPITDDKLSYKEEWKILQSLLAE